MTKKIRYYEDGKNITLVSLEGEKPVGDLPEAFAEFGIDMCRLTNELIDDATEIFDTGWRVVDIERIEKQIYE